MTVSQSIIKWLKEFSPESMKHIDTDRLRSNVNFALVKEPMTNVRKYISGVEIHKDYYQFVVRLDTQTDKSCIENGSWMEQLTDWIEDRNRNRKSIKSVFYGREWAERSIISNDNFYRI